MARWTYLESKEGQARHGCDDVSGGVLSVRKRVHGSEETAAWVLRQRLPATRCRRKRLKLEIYTEFHGLSHQKLIDPETGETVICTTVNFTPRGWELLGRYCAKSGQTAEEWIGEELKAIYAEEGLEVVGDTRIVYPKASQGAKREAPGNQPGAKPNTKGGPSRNVTSNCTKIAT